mgnify:CR=1 FL=1
MTIDDYCNKGGHNDTPPTYPRPKPPKGQGDRTLSVSMEDIISNMDIPNKDKEHLYLDVLRQQGVTDVTVVWSEGKIVGFSPNQPMEQVSLTIKIGGISYYKDRRINGIHRSSRRHNKETH